MTAAIDSFVIRGSEAVPVTVSAYRKEARSPLVGILGLPGGQALDLQNTVRSAIRLSGFGLIPENVTLAVSPSLEGLRSIDASGLGLALVEAYLVETGQVPAPEPDTYCLFGRLGPDGSVSPARGCAVCAHALGGGGKLVTSASEEGAVGLGTEVLAVGSTPDLRGRLGDLTVTRPGPTGATIDEASLGPTEVMLTEGERQALVAAATGRHGLLIVGPGSRDKATLASVPRRILPPLTDGQEASCRMALSLATHGPALRGLERDGLGAIPPERVVSAHISMGGLMGGGRTPLPGEVTLADQGVLVLQDLPAFPQGALRALAQAQEEGCVRLTRTDGTFTFPAGFMLVATADPCPCGSFGDVGGDCLCPPSLIERWQDGLSRGPLRLDIRIDAAGSPSPGLAPAKISDLRQQVADALAFRADRLRHHPDTEVPAGQAGRLLLAVEEPRRRSVGSVARTLADMDASAMVGSDHVLGAMSLTPASVDAAALRLISQGPSPLAPSAESVRAQAGEALARREPDESSVRPRERGRYI